MEVLSPDQQTAILKRLVSLDADGKLEWEWLSDFQFEAVVGATGFIISSKDEDDVAPFELDIFRDGQLLQTIETVVGAQGEDAERNRLLAVIYESAKRRGLHLDDVVQAIFGDLEL